VERSYAQGPVKKGPDDNGGSVGRRDAHDNRREVMGRHARLDEYTVRVDRLQTSGMRSIKLEIQTSTGEVYRLHLEPETDIEDMRADCRWGDDGGRNLLD
jgi:hypothetical protein